MFLVLKFSEVYFQGPKLKLLLIFSSSNRVGDVLIIVFFSEAWYLPKSPGRFDFESPSRRYDFRILCKYKMAEGEQQEIDKEWEEIY